MASNYQDNRSVKITSPFGTDVLVLERLAGVEQLSQPFHYDLSLLSDHGDLDADQILGKPLALELTITQGQAPRHFHGIVTEFAQSGFGERLHQYQATVRPWYWLLTRTADCRIFQGKSVPDIFKAVCNQAGFSDVEPRLAGTYDPWEYCVQYRETDFNFLSRLLEQEGIFYYFEHAADKHVLVLTDDVGQCSSVSGYESVPFYPATATDAQRERDHLQSWSFQKTFQPGAFATRDWDYERPASIPAGTASISRAHNPSKFEIYDYPAEATQLTSGGLERVAKLRVQELQCTQMVARGHGDAAGLAAGKLFKLTDYPRADLNLQYLVSSTSIELNADNYQSGSASQGTQFMLSVEAVDAREPYRPARITPKPLIHGTQTAVVVGPKGEEIYTDSLGRVKVQFHWDRYGKSDDKSSCFIRVGQLWADKGWGSLHIPRMGEEVIVSFVEGDPDDPLIIGCVYNGTNKPPYTLPENKTQSGILSRSTLNGTSDNANEFRFEDMKGSELVLLHAEKDHTVEVENNETHTVGNDRKKNVQNNENTSIGANRTESVGGDESINIGKNRTESVGASETISVSKDHSQTVSGTRTRMVEKDETVTINGKRTETVGKDEEISIGKNRTHSISEKDSLTVGKQLIIDAGEEVVIKTGSASLTMKKDGTIELQGADVTVKGSGKINVNADSDVVVKGSKVSMN
jgi:type VI secretion system secreted protein VgrG